MKIPRLLALAAMTLGTCQATLAQTRTPACPFLGQPVKLTKKTIAVFTAAGKFLRDAQDKEVAADARVLACNEELGLVKILLDGKENWVDRLAVSIRPAGGGTCVTKSPTRAADRTEPVSSGIGENCVPEKSPP